MATTTQRDYYEVLSISREASAAEIKKAYRKLAIKFHPDRNPDDARAEALFKEAAEAYSVLSDEDKRARYDRFGHAGVQGGFSGFEASTFGDFSDILGDLFGFGRRRRGRQGVPGSDLRYELEISFEDAAFGAKRSIEFPRLERCDRCDGSGSADGEASVCHTCGGAGQVRLQQGFFSVARTCPDCRGEGRRVSNPCGECHGDGRVARQRELELDIPAGIDDGMRLRLRGEGEQGVRGGMNGDLDVVVHISPHERWQRDGADVHEVVALAYPQLVLGAKIEVATLHGEETVRIPPGTQIGHEFTLRGQGIPHLRGDRRGDHVVHVQLEVPKPRELDEERRELLRQLAELDDVQVSREGVMGKMKNLFQ